MQRRIFGALGTQAAFKKRDLSDIECHPFGLITQNIFFNASGMFKPRESEVRTEGSLFGRKSERRERQFEFSRERRARALRVMNARPQHARGMRIRKHPDSIDAENKSGTAARNGIHDCGNFRNL